MLFQLKRRVLVATCGCQGGISTYFSLKLADLDFLFCKNLQFHFFKYLSSSLWQMTLKLLLLCPVLHHLSEGRGEFISKQVWKV